MGHHCLWSFDIVFFDTNSYPTEKAVEYANENPSLFNKYSFNAISVESESVAKKILSQINNAEITFEDALTEYSKNYYTTTDGVLKNKYDAQIQELNRLSAFINSKVENKKTMTNVELLNEEDTIKEIARIASGDITEIDVHTIPNHTVPAIFLLR